jgi:hypothetical protein
MHESPHLLGKEVSGGESGNAGYKNFVHVTLR